MSADRLREAARVLRERARTATPGPWESHEEDPDEYGVTEWAIFMPDAGHDGALVERRSDADFIATMHPGVGLALAELLDGLACDSPWDFRHDNALAIADLILGGQS